jgi:hypothetical protein
MSHQAVLRRLEDVARRVRQLRLMLVLAMVWLVAAAVAGVVLWIGQTEERSVAAWLPAIGLAAIGVAGFCVWRMWRSTGDLCALARRVESAFPDLEATLLTAIEQRPASDGGYGFMQEGVIRRAFFHSYKNRWTQIVPQRQLVLAYAANVASASVLVAALVALAMFTPPTPAVEAAVLAFDEAVITRQYHAEIEPGNTEVERGTSLLVLARFKGELPPDATLVYQFDADPNATNREAASENTAADANQRQVAMTKSLDDPVFGGRIASIVRPLSYRVVYTEKVSPEYRVTVFDYPELVRADTLLAFPTYTKLEDKLVQDVRRISAVEGTRLTLTCVLNKPVAKAELVEVAATENEPAEPIALAVVEGQASSYATTMTLDRSRRLELRLVDADGRANRRKAEFTINVLPNRPADLKLIAPAKDVEASPIEELDVRASAWDDFGLSRVGVSYAIAGQPPVDVVLGEGMPGKQHTPVEHVIAFEQLKAEPDQLLSYYFWAEDIDSAGKPRRTSSDMFFVEVRHFEEIFRQGEQPTEGQMAEQQRQQQQQQQQAGQNAQQAEQLAELQKQIINSTWKIIRRETSLPPSETFKSDVELLVESQNSAREQAEGLGERVQDEQSQAHLGAVLKHMEEAATRLTSAKDGPSLDMLPAALSAEQAAYQGLLKLRAREHEVVRANRQQQSQQQQQQQNQSARNSENSRAQDQLNELELREDENRYETQQTATEQQQETAEQREDRQVLNRLRELSRRQEGLNERIKELQSALEAAETPEAKDDIERQLKRLRDEQQQIVRDAEELQERMERPENQQRMSEERQQLEQARENARQSSEALREGQASQAAAEGERAERELNQLRDEFQERTGGQFAEDVRQMREQARELDRREGELSERLEQLDEQPANAGNLNDADERPQIAEALRNQQERLGELLEQMRRTVEEAETSQPLLAEKLYDSIRENQRQNPERNLSSAEQSLRRGLVDDAQSEEQQARTGISRLRENVDRAAESVLGSDTEALEQALDRIRTAREQLQGEIDRESAESGAERSSRSENERRGENGNEQRGEAQEGGDEQNRGRSGNRQQNENGERSPNEEEGQPGQGGDREGERQGDEERRGEGQRGESQNGERESQQEQNGERRGEAQDRESQSRESQGQEAEGREGQRGEGQQNERPQSGEGQQEGQQSGQGGRGNRQPGENPSQERQPGERQEGQERSDERSNEEQNGEGQQGRGQGQRQGNRGQRGERNTDETSADERGNEQGDRNPQEQANENAPNRGEPRGNPQRGQQGERSGRGEPNNRGGRAGQRRNGDDRPVGGGAGLDEFLNPFDDDPNSDDRPDEERDIPPASPIAGEDFLDWSDRLRDVEEMIADPELRAEAARIREQAKDIRKEVKRHSAPPNWDVVRERVAEPLAELQRRVADELLRRSAGEALVPIDRDPVPAEFEELVRRYYEELGAGE